MINAYGGAFTAVFIAVHAVCLIALIHRRNDYADVFWGPGFLFAALGALLTTGFQLGLREVLILLCIAVWAIRLFYHIGLRSLKKKSEDIRYLNWRKDWGQTWIWRSYLQVFVLQALLLFVIALPIIYSVEKAPREMSPLVFLGVFLWLVGFLFESISDAQLKKFKAEPGNKGQIMTRGLWGWSRHPNYFGEVLQWWALFLMAVDLSSLWLIISPVAINFLILKVSGVPMLEELMEGRPGFQDYKKRTPIFFPWFPKN